MLIAGALALAGCGSDGDTRADGDRNVIKEEVLDREINVEGVIRGHKTGAPLDNILVTLIQGGKVKEAKTVGLNGHYAFLKVKVASDQGAQSDAENSANSIQLEFSEIKTKKLNGDGDLVSGSDLYPNGTTTPSYPESRISFNLVSPDLSGPELNAADDSAGDFAEDTAGALNPQQSLSLVDAINEGRSYYFVDANTVRIRDVRLVQTGVLTGTVIDSDTGLPVQNAYVTISTDPYFRIATQKLDQSDIVAVWQQTRITASLSTATGAFTFESIPALDYDTSYAAADLHVEAQGYLENTAAGWPDHANIRDDLVGTVGVLLISPIKVTLKTVNMTFVDQNLTALPGVTVTFKYDSAETNATGYGTALANSIATDTRWVATSNASGVASVSVPNIGYNNVGAATQDFTAKLTGYKLDDSLPLFSALVVDEDDLKLDLSTFGGVDNTVDLGVIKMIPDTKNFASEFKVQLIYNNAPIVGATVSGTAKYVDADVSALAITVLFSGDAVSDSNGFVTFNTNKIPASKAGLSVTFNFDVSLTGATSIVSALAGTYVVDDADDLDLTENAYNDASVTTKDVNDIKTITLKDKQLKLSGLEGYIVTGKAGASANTGTVSFEEAEGVNLRLKVTNGASITNYFTTTDANGYYAFLASDGVVIPVDTAAASLNLDITVLGDFIFSGGTNTIDLDQPVPAANGVDQLDSDGVNADLTWLWQLPQGTAGSLELKYDGKTLAVHTAAIEPNNAAELGYHVVTLLKTVAGVSTLSVIQNNNNGDKVYTYTQSQDDATGIQIVMSSAVDSTLPFKYNGLTGANLNPDDKTANRLEIINFQNGTQGNEIPDGTVLTFTATASGRTVTIVPSGNANKFQTQVTYQLKLRLVSTTGEVSDDTLFFRFYNAETEKFTTQVPSYDVSTMTLNKYWFLYNNVAVDADNVKFGLNRNGGAIVAGDVHILVYKDGTGFGGATGGFQTQALNLNALSLRFAIPTDVRTSAAAAITNATVVAEIDNKFKVWAQAYTTSGIILQHWTDVTNVAVSVAANNQFLTYEAGYLKIGADLSGQDAIWAKTIAEGNKIDLTVVHENSQIDPSATKVLTISSTSLSGMQAKTLAQAAGDNNPVTSEAWTLTLDSRVNATASSTPTATTTMPGVTLSNVRYTAANEITADAFLSFGNGTDVTVSATTSLNIASANIMVKSAAGSSLVLSTGTVAATLQTLSNEMRVGRNLRWDSDGATATTAAANSQIQSVATIIHTTIPIISSTAKDYTYGATGLISDNMADNSTTTAIDIDRTAGAQLSGVAVGNVDPARTWDVKYNALSDGRLKRLLNSLEVGDIINATGNNFYLRVTVAPAANVFTAIEAGQFSSDVRTSLGYDGTASTVGGALVIAPQVRLASTTFESDNTTAGIADAVAAGSDASTGFRGSSNETFVIVDSTTVEVTSTALDLYAGDTVYLMTESVTATNGNEPIYSATVAGSISSAGNGTTLVALSSVTQVRGTTESFNAGGQTARASGFVFYGDQVTITSLGSGVTSLHSSATLNTNGDAVTTNAFTDGNDVQNDNAEGFNGVK